MPSWPEAAAAKGAIALELRLRFDGEAGPGNGVEAGFWNGFAGQFASAVSALLDALESFLDFVDGVLVCGEQTEGEIAIEIVSSRIGHVEAVAGHFLGGLFGEAAHLIEETFAQVEQIAVVFLPFGFNFGAGFSRVRLG